MKTGYNIRFDQKRLRRAGETARYASTGLLEIGVMEHRQKSSMESGDDAVALYHIIYKHEGFEESAQNLFKLVQQAER